MRDFDLSRLLDSLPHCHVAVIGDLMLDEYLWGHIERISPEAPVPILNVVSRSSTLGGAGNVVENLRSLGVAVTVLGVVGDDETGRQIRDLLRTHGANVAGVITDTQRKSTRKARLMSLEHGQQVFRLDEESTSPLEITLAENMIGIIRGLKAGIQTIVCSDYLKGVLSEGVLAEAFSSAQRLGIRSIVAPKDTHPRKYQGANILMPNARELMQLSGQKSAAESSLDHRARHLVEKLSLNGLVVTRGGEGMSLFEKSETGLRRVDIPTTARSVYDVTGAGDTAIAAFAAAVASGSALETAARFANITAGIKVGKRGTASVSADEIRAAQKI
ncbi:MAG: PfkB family carbohydrate kinase [Acidobacteriota bacterium]|nr:PfkB family carbohydrate kinase [Acidobacteriota bacterium]